MGEDQFRVKLGRGLHACENDLAATVNDNSARRCFCSLRCLLSFIERYQVTFFDWTDEKQTRDHVKLIAATDV